MYGEGKTRGKSSELSFPSTTNQACAAIVLNSDHKHFRHYLKLVFDANYEANRRLASGGVQPNLSLGLIKSMALRLPPPSEVDVIVAEVERQFPIIGAIAKTIDTGLARANTLRQSVLSQAFSGKLTGVA